MMKGGFLILILLFLQIFASAQKPVGSWEDHLPYQSIRSVTSDGNTIYAATEYALLVYNSEYEELKKLSRVQGLSESGISAISFSKDQKTLVICYNSTNIDLYNGTRVTNIPDVLNKYVAGRKEINSVITSGRYAYLATSFGIIVVDLERAEIKDTWNPSLNGTSIEVYDLKFFGNRVYASTSHGLMSADPGNPALTYYGNWSAEPLFSGAHYRHLETVGEYLYVSTEGGDIPGDSLIRTDLTERVTISSGSGENIESISAGGDFLFVATGGELRIHNPDGSEIRRIDSYDISVPAINAAHLSTGKLFLGDNNLGIVVEESPGSYRSLIVDGPYYNSASAVYSENGSVYISGGLLDNAWNNTWTSFRSFTFENRKWRSSLIPDSWDVMRIRPDRTRDGSIYISTWGSGLYRMDGAEVSVHFTEANSPLQNIIPGAAYVRICGLAFDNNDLLWITQTGVENSIKILKPDDSWIVLPYTIEAPTIGDIIITSSDMKWIVLPRGHGLFVLDDNHTPDSFDDDRWKKLNVKDQDGRTLNMIYSIAEDLDGNIWIGTDQGPAVFYNPSSVFSEDINCYRIKIARDDGSGLADYLLGTEIINSVAIDGGNRKWFGTNSSGLFLVSEDGRELLREYNTRNTPLLSNTITSVDIDDKTGEVWIGTDRGVVTVRESATSGDDIFNHVYAFPNPVYPDFNGDVTITGLVRETTVKITDISGNLVYETISTGGQATWPVTNSAGRRVSTGVYLAFCSSPGGEASEVTKIVVIR